MMHLLPCSFNFRSDHCGPPPVCESVQDGGDIYILHGNKQVFYRKEYIFFIQLQEYFQKFNIITDNYKRDLVVPFRKLVESWKNGENKTRGNCENVVDIIFRDFINI